MHNNNYERIKDMIFTTTTATKEFTFCAAHLLGGHDGKCKNLHGHNFQLTVTCKPFTEAMEVGEDGLIPFGSSEGMIIDFKDLKDMVNKYIIDKLDHSFIYDINDVNQCEIATLLTAKGMKVFPFEKRTTCEHLAKWIFAELRKELIPVCNIKLRESPTSYAEVTDLCKS